MCNFIRSNWLSLSLALPIAWKTFDVAFHRLNKGSVFDAIELGQLGIQHHFLPADQVNTTFDDLGLN